MEDKYHMFLCENSKVELQEVEHRTVVTRAWERFRGGTQAEKQGSGFQGAD